MRNTPFSVLNANIVIQRYIASKSEHLPTSNCNLPDIPIFPQEIRQIAPEKTGKLPYIYRNKRDSIVKTISLLNTSFRPYLSTLPAFNPISAQQSIETVKFGQPGLSPSIKLALQRKAPTTACPKANPPSFAGSRDGAITFSPCSWIRSRVAY
ncbi:MAG: hypothetical protein P8101_13300 [Candidatus Thiodiazotropha sp.]